VTKLPGLLCVAALLLSDPLAHAQETPHPFETPASLLPAVGFWVRVYSEWDTSHVVIHDSAQVDVLYRVLDLTEFNPDDGDSTLVRQAKLAARITAVAQARTDLEVALEALDQKRPESAKGLTGAQREAFVAWQSHAEDPDRFGHAAQRVRSQRGISDKYSAGYRQSGRFLGAIQKALKEAGHPEGLVALAFTESLMNLHARSVSGALGPWQFLSGTGREYMAINTVVDERKDPLLATLSAARYLHNSKKRLGSWGAAITAYNYGTNGMSRAVEQLGTSNIETILAGYKTGRFGFAAKNYYAEFLASLHVLSHAELYFKGVKPVAPWQFDLVTLPRSTKAAELWALRVDRDDLAELNPALTSGASAGLVALPRGLTLRIPAGQGKAVLAHLSKDLAEDDAVAIARTVTLKKGQTLLAIARKYNVSLGELCAVNGLSPTDPVNAGQALKVPAARTGFTSLPEAVDGRVVSVTFARPEPLRAHAASLASQRPAPEAVLVAFGDDKPATPGRKSKDLVLASALPTQELEPVVLGQVPQSGPPVMLRVPHRGGARIVAGPATELEETFADDSVDIVSGDVSLPGIDMTTSGDALQDGTPVQPLPVVMPASYAGPQS